MLTADQVVGNQDDWADYITETDEHETPMLKLLEKGTKPVNVLYQYQADSFDEPTPVAWPDGKDWDVFQSAAQNRKELKARIQWWVKTAAVSKLAQDVTNAAGVRDELAREIPRKLEEMGRTMECAISSDQVAYEDDGVNGNQTQGMGKWIQATTTTQLYATPALYLTPAASIYSGTLANLNEDALIAVLGSMWRVTGVKGHITGIVGMSLKSRITTFQHYTPSSLSTAGTARHTNRDQSNRRLGSPVDFYDSDFGDVELHLSKWLAHANFGGSLGKSNWRGYFFRPRMWQIRWNQKPTVYKPEFKGGSYKAAMDCLAMLVCKNPIGEGKIDPSDA